MKKAIGLLAALSIGAFGCGGSSSDNSGTGGTLNVSDLCQTDPTGACAGECAFEPPSELDCMNACASIAALCESGCMGECEGINLDPTLCAAACEGAKGQRCTNLVFGCYDENDTCESVSNCVVSAG
jgi:hypothetical protein